MILLLAARYERTTTNGWLVFTSPFQFAQTNFSRRLDGIGACSIARWFFVLRRGEQVLLKRGMLETAPSGERTFRPARDWVNCSSARISTDA